MKFAAPDLENSSEIAGLLFPRQIIPNQKKRCIMKKAVFVLSLLFFVNSICFAQMAGNQVFGSQNNQNNLRKPETGNGSLKTNESPDYQTYSIESSVLLNVPPDSYIAVFGFDRLGSTSDNSNAQVNASFENFAKDLQALGISKNDVYVDFITQTTTIVDRTTRAFQTRKTIAVKYSDRKLFEKIVTLAASKDIFDLVKVDFVVSDLEKVRTELFAQASQMLKSKHKKYMDTFGITLVPQGLAIERYDAFYPSERYKGYEKSFFYEPIEQKGLDRVINSVGIDPMVQFTIYLRMDYDIPKSKEK
jgi:preprotein translocase subunit SecG